MIELPPPLILPDHWVAKKPSIIQVEPNIERYFPQHLTKKGQVKGMLPGMIPLIAGATVPPILPTWTDSASSTVTDSNNRTFAGASLGSASATRYVLVFASARGTAGASCTISALTIGGVSATLLVASASISNPTAIFGLLVTSGTSANIVVTSSGSTMSRASIGVANITNYNSITPTDTDSTTGTTVTSLALPLTMSAGGVGFWCVSTADVAGVTWTNATEQYDVSPGTVMRGSAALYQDSSGSTRTATAAWAAANGSMCAASFR